MRPNNNSNDNAHGMDVVIVEHTIFYKSIDISTNSRIHTRALQVAVAQTQADPHKHPRAHETTTAQTLMNNRIIIH